MGSEHGADRTPCPHCGHLNREGSKFCGECGGAVAVSACSKCGSQNPIGQRFCNECGSQLPAGDGAPDRAVQTDPRGDLASGEGAPTVGAEAPVAGANPTELLAGDLPSIAPDIEVPAHLSKRIQDDAAALAGERKQVTVLFADVMGSMQLAEQIDPERWREIMDRLFKLLAEAVHRYEGTVDKFTGDGLMALFGAPIAHEDHPQRACFAALSMLEEAGAYAAELRRTEEINLSLRIGINSGEVVVGSIGADLSLSYTAIGHTVGLAQRMEALAEPGTAVVTEHTAELAAGYVELLELGQFEVKGASQPITGYELAGTGSARGRLDLSRQRGFSRFVGRGDELASLESALESALEGDGRAVGLIADAGVGKSRLCHEFLERCRARGVPVYEAQCLSHARTLPLLPVLQIMRAYFGINPDDSDRTAREKIAGRLLLLDPAFAEELPIVFDFLAVPDPQREIPQMNPEARQRRLVEVVRHLVSAPGRNEPAVVLIEDLHWIDPASEAFLAGLVDAVPGTETLLVTNARPEYGAGWRGRAHYSELRLEPLSPEALSELFTDLIGTDPSVDGLEEVIRERSGGNPFFIEEIVRELADTAALEGERGAYRLVREIEELDVPPAVQAILAARIDRLDADAKAVLQTASAIGVEFRRDVLEASVEIEDPQLADAIQALIDAEFIYETSLYPQPEYALVHPLTQEVAYGSLLTETRRRVHAAIAGAIQHLEPDDLDELAGLVARHYEMADDALQAARWHARAAGWAGFNDPNSALGHWQRVRELDAELPEGDEPDALRSTSRLMITSVGWRLGVDLDDIREVFTEGKEIAMRADDTATLALLHLGLGVAVGLCGGYMSEYLRLAREAQGFAAESDNTALEVLTALGLVYPLFLAGQFEESLAAADRVLELTADDPQIGAGVVVGNPRAWSTSFRALALMALGRFEEARVAVAEGAELCRRWDRESLGWNYGQACLLVEWGGNPKGPDYMANARQAVEIAETIGDAFSRVVASVRLGNAQASRGEYEDALGTYQRGLELITERGAGRDFEPFIHGYRAEALIALDAAEQAVAEGELALRLADERGLRVQAPLQRRVLATALVHRRAAGDLDRAEELLDEAAESARELGARGHLASLGSVRARLYEARGDDASRRRALTEALKLAEEIDALGFVEELRADLDLDQVPN